MINKTVENNTLCFTIEGSLDTGNSEQAQEEMLEAINNSEVNKVVIDLDKLNYISSAGLRVLFKIKQMIDDTTIKNASLAVYEIFDISGLNQLMDVNKSLQDVDISGATEVQKGNTGTVYQLADGTQIKVYDSYDVDEVQEEIVLGQSALAFGASNSISFDIVKVGSKFAVKFSLMPFESFTDAIVQNPDKFDDYMDKFFDAFMHLSSVECPEDELCSVDEILHKRLDRLSGHISSEAKAILDEMIDSLKDGYDLVHGDITPASFNLLEGELVLVNNAKLLEGPAIYDVYCLQRYFSEVDDFDKSQMQHILGLDKDTIHKVSDAFYDRYFSQEDKATKADKIAKIDLASTLEKYLYLGTKSDERIKELAGIFEEKYLKPIIIPRKDEICELLRTL